MKTRLDILLIDDDEADAAFFDIAVDKTRLDIRLQTLSSGQQAIEHLQGKGEYGDRSLHPLPDAIVLDLRMPKVSGFDFLAWRKGSALLSGIPVVVFTGLKVHDEVGRVLALGATRHIVKPVDFEEWEKVVAGDMGSCKPQHCALQRKALGKEHAAFVRTWMGTE